MRTHSLVTTHLLECKNCSYHKAHEWAKGAYPIYYELQLRYYLAVEDTTNASKQEHTDKELTSDEKYNKALAFIYSFPKYLGRTLGEIMEIDMAAIEYLANKQSKNIAAKEAATCILENRVAA